MKRKSVLLFCILFISLSTMYAQSNLKLRYLSTKDGIPENKINDMIPLDDGRLALLTPNLLVIYDGSLFKTFSLSEEYSYPIANSNATMSLVDTHFLWIKNRTKLYVYDVSKRCFLKDVRERIKKIGFDKSLSNIYISKNVFLGQTYDKHLIYLNRTNNEVYSSYSEISIDDVSLTDTTSWFFHDGKYISCWNLKKSMIEDLNFTFKTSKNSDEKVYIKTTPSGNLWCMKSNQISFYNKYKNKWNSMKLSIPSTELFTSLYVDYRGYAYIGSTNGIVYVINNTDFSYTTLKLFDFAGNCINSDIIKIDKNAIDGSLWFVFYGGSIGYYTPSYNRFKPFYSINSSTLRGENTVNSIFQFSRNNYYLATMNGLYDYNKVTHSKKLVKNKFRGQPCRTLYNDSDNTLWLGTLRQGLYSIKDGLIDHYSIDDNNIRLICEDQFENLWIGVYDGLIRFDKETHKLTRLYKSHPELKDYVSPFRIVSWDKKSFLCVCENGFYLYDIEKDKVKTNNYSSISDKRFQFFNYHFTGAYRDSRGLIWLVSNKQIIILGSQKDEVYTIDKRKLGPTILSNFFQEDQINHIWFASLGEMFKVIVGGSEGKYTFDIIHYNENSGVLPMQYYCAYLDKEDHLLFGGSNGVVAVSSSASLTNMHVHTPILTSVIINDIPVEVGEIYNGRILLAKSSVFQRNITLNYDENNISFICSGLNYSNPSLTYYKYRLIGIDEEWKYSKFHRSGIGEISYSNLSPGKYRLEVYSANSDKIWSKTPLQFSLTIIPPFYQTFWAYLIYGIILIVFLVLLMLLSSRISMQKIRRQKDKEIREKEEEMTLMKYRFFTNVSHEFRTPLTLIITPLKSLLVNLEDASLKAKLNVVLKNALQLNVLVDQLLDFRRLESNDETLCINRLPIGNLADSAYQTFLPLAKEKNITFELDNQIHDLFANLDANKMNKVLVNLLSNAFKFTEEFGLVRLSFDTVMKNEFKFLIITITDTGIGIAEDEIVHIFDRFYQAKNAKIHHAGTGIGLHIVKQYIDMHHGDIEVTSKLGKGTSFTLTIPMNEEKDESPLEASSIKLKKYPYSIVLIEDNPDLNLFLTESLSGYYNVLSANNAIEGIKLAESENVHLIISDVMLPKIDGYEVCRRIKGQLQTSHIPIILLTAKTTDESRIEGYKVGADSYIIKPFNLDVLLVRIRTLIDQQDKKRKNPCDEIDLLPSNVISSKLDEEFLMGVLNCVEENIENSSFSTEDIAQVMNVSKSTLYRKIQMLTGENVIGFIRSVRLKKAVQLLKTKEYSISEVSYKVGFSTPRYFSKLFKETYGVLPSRYNN